MASRRRRRTDSDNSGATVGEVTSIRPCNMKDERSREDPAAAGSTFSSDNRHDRSLEFGAIVRSIVQSGQATERQPLKKSSDSLNSKRNEFTILAKKLSRDLASVYSKLDKLTLLAKRKSIFDAKETEIDQLTFVIKQDLGLLNKQISQLQELSRAQKMISGHDKQTHANSVLVTLQSKLAVMTSDFRSVLHVRTETLQQQQNRRSEFSSSSANVSSSLPSSSSASKSSNNKWLLLDEANRDDVSIDMNNVQYNGPMMQQLQGTEDRLMQSRADTMKNIEQTIVELGSIYQQLAHMVQEQGEMVHRQQCRGDADERRLGPQRNRPLLSVGLIQSMARGQNICGSHCLLYLLCHLHGLEILCFAASEGSNNGPLLVLGPDRPSPAGIRSPASDEDAHRVPSP